ncbi:PREDICTED: nascent polypeptide-associated complex subunit alpha, muscle-specific form-like [Pseudopodoces humilis]|uniref:nascent polypeptide-associated complex subunit alpha, muscle-specific form-like n=1 Tax=Pseudopodoces humilis TaxID=181119 RepID=UPI0006B70380|nr:PREDICTED: nascent polypeptide-associated complex subunit alpha, muscle-specific form-like [Pseudopodoces humilis]
MARGALPLLCCAAALLAAAAPDRRTLPLPDDAAPVLPNRLVLAPRHRLSTPGTKGAPAFRATVGPPFPAWAPRTLPAPRGGLGSPILAQWVLGPGFNTILAEGGSCGDPPSHTVPLGFGQIRGTASTARQTCSVPRGHRSVPTTPGPEGGPTPGSKPPPTSPSSTTTTPTPSHATASAASSAPPSSTSTAPAPSSTPGSMTPPTSPSRTSTASSSTTTAPAPSHTNASRSTPHPSNSTATPAPSSPRPASPSSPAPTVSLGPNSTSSASTSTSSRMTAATDGTAGSSRQHPTEPSPAVVVIISLSVCVLVAGAAALLVRLSRRGTPRFQHLDEVPMGGLLRWRRDEEEEDGGESRWLRGLRAEPLPVHRPCLSPSAPRPVTPRYPRLRLRTVSGRGRQRATGARYRRAGGAARAGPSERDQQGAPGAAPRSPHRRSVSRQRCRDPSEAAPSGPGPGAAVGAVRRRFSGTPLLPPLGCRLAEAARAPEPEAARVVFTIEESGPSSGDESEPPR